MMAYPRGPDRRSSAAPAAARAPRAAEISMMTANRQRRAPVRSPRRLSATGL